MWSGESLHSANITGGLHHAMPDRASGFCIYNDLAIGIRWLLDHGAEQGRLRRRRRPPRRRRRERSSTTTRGCSRSPCTRPARRCSPAPASRRTSAAPSARGSAVNVALPPGTSDAGWLRAFHAVVPPLLREFAPDILVTQHGCDSHRDDPLADLMLSVDGQRASYLALHDLAHEVCDGGGWSTGGGGYALVEVVPRAWTHLLSVVGGHPLDVATPTPDGVARATSASASAGAAPHRLTDGRDPAYRDWSEGYDPGTWLDRTINATREEIFPLHGLDPLP